jgi:hypothetical protein
VFVSARDSLIPLPFLGLAGQAGKLKRAKELSNRASQQTTRKLFRAVERQKKKTWQAGRAVSAEMKYER